MDTGSVSSISSDLINQFIQNPQRYQEGAYTFETSGKFLTNVSSGCHSFEEEENFPY